MYVLNLFINRFCKCTEKNDSYCRCETSNMHLYRIQPEFAYENFFAFQHIVFVVRNLIRRNICTYAKVLITAPLKIYFYFVLCISDSRYTRGCAARNDSHLYHLGVVDKGNMFSKLINLQVLLCTESEESGI